MPHTFEMSEQNVMSISQSGQMDAEYVYVVCGIAIFIDRMKIQHMVLHIAYVFFLGVSTRLLVVTINDTVPIAHDPLI